MKLIIKFNLAFVGIFLIGLGNAAYISNRVLEQNAREEVLQNARVAMESALAIQAYTAKQVKPLLETQMKYAFLPQSVPPYSATEVLHTVRTKFPEYSYKEATLNPTNVRNRADEWEAGIIQQFRAEPERQEIISERDTPGGRMLYIARPIQIKDASCLACHSTAEAAPKTLVALYGSQNGFGWQMNEVVGAQMIAVSADLAGQRATTAFHTFIFSLTGVFIFIGIALNFMLYEMVIQPVGKLSRLADQVSMGHLDTPAVHVHTKDEIGVLAASLNRMRRSLIEALKMLGN